MIKQIVNDIGEFFIDATELQRIGIAEITKYDTVPLCKTFNDFKRAIAKTSGPIHVELNGDRDYTRRAITHAVAARGKDCVFSAEWTTSQALYYKTLFEKKVLALRNPNMNWPQAHERFRPYKGMLYMPVESIGQFSDKVAEGIVLTAEAFRNAVAASPDGHRMQYHHTG